MAGILERLAGNKMIAKLAFKQLVSYIEKEKISFIVLFVNNDGDIDTKEYREQMAIIRKEDYDFLIANQNTNEQPK